MITVSEFINCTDKLTAGFITPEEWQDVVLGERRMYGETLKRVGRWCQSLANELVNDDDHNTAIDVNNNKIERRKLSDATRELNEKIRWIADHDYMMETICDSVRQLEPLPPINSDFIPPETGEQSRHGLLLLADQHFGCEFDVGLNKYNPDIYYDRMETLFESIYHDNRWMNLKTIDVYCLGDMVDGILRMSSIQKQKIPVIDACLKFAEHMAFWLNQLQKCTNAHVIFGLIGGNHDNMRLLQSRPTFEEESYAKVIHAFIKIRLESNPGISIVDYENIDSQVISIGKYECVLSHTETDKAFDFYNAMYGTVDRIYCGHLHNYSVETCGRNCRENDMMLVHVPSIMGTDPYAKKLRKNSSAGAYFELFDQYGETMFSKVYTLN